MNDESEGTSHKHIFTNTVQFITYLITLRSYWQRYEVAHTNKGFANKQP
jgi:hypothetical protein